jgi:hypothetical protein
VDYGSPSDCKGITEEQFALFKASMNYSDLPKVIADIQQTLIAPRGICSKVGEALGLCSSSKKGGKKKSKGKSRKGKDRRRKGKSRRKNN